MYRSKIWSNRDETEINQEKIKIKKKKLKTFLKKHALI